MPNRTFFLSITNHQKCKFHKLNLLQNPTKI